jgi:undecaprenyl-diphosphatase
VLRALILGLVQGLTEFLPISSSGHLTIFADVLGYSTPALSFSVFLHIGTLLAVVAYFHRDLWAFVLSLVAPGRLGAADARVRRRLLGLLALASVPVAVAGYLLEDWADRQAARPLSAAWWLLATTSLLIAAELYAKRRQPQPAAQLQPVNGQQHEPAPAPPAPATAEASQAELERLPLRKALGVGAAQALALIPGTSRSGATVSAGLLLGVSRETAARFSFLLSIPVTVGAILVKLGDMGHGTESGAELAVGFVAATISGFVAVAWLLRLLRTGTMWPFIWYRLIAGAVFVVILSG